MNYSFNVHQVLGISAPGSIRVSMVFVVTAVSEGSYEVSVLEGGSGDYLFNPQTRRAMQLDNPNTGIEAMVAFVGPAQGGLSNAGYQTLADYMNAQIARGITSVQET